MPPNGQRRPPIRAVALQLASPPMEREARHYQNSRTTKAHDLSHHTSREGVITVVPLRRQIFYGRELEEMDRAVQLLTSPDPRQLATQGQHLHSATSCCRCGLPRTRTRTIFSALSCTSRPLPVMPRPLSHPRPVRMQARRAGHARHHTTIHTAMQLQKHRQSVTSW